MIWYSRIVAALVFLQPPRQLVCDALGQKAKLDSNNNVVIARGCGSGYLVNRFHTYRFRFHQQKTRKRPLTIFFNFCGSVACLLLHFIILRRQKRPYIAITLATSLKLIVSNYSLLVFASILELVLNVDHCGTPEIPRVCHGAPTDKKLEIPNCL